MPATAETPLVISAGDIEHEVRKCSGPARLRPIHGSNHAIVSGGWRSGHASFHGNPFPIKEEAWP
jgi:hypothetical protein